MMATSFMNLLPLWALILAEIVITEAMLAWAECVFANWIHCWSWKAEKDKQTMTREERRFLTLRERKKRGRRLTGNRIANVSLCGGYVL